MDTETTEVRELQTIADFSLPQSVFEERPIPRNEMTESEQFVKPFLMRNLPLTLRECSGREKVSLEGRIFVKHLFSKL